MGMVNKIYNGTADFVGRVLNPMGYLGGVHRLGRYIEKKNLPGASWDRYAIVHCFDIDTKEKVDIDVSSIGSFPFRTIKCSRNLPKGMVAKAIKRMIRGSHYYPSILRKVEEQRIGISYVIISYVKDRTLNIETIDTTDILKLRKEKDEAIKKINDLEAKLENLNIKNQEIERLKGTIELIKEKVEKIKSELDEYGSISDFENNISIFRKLMEIKGEIGKLWIFLEGGS